MKYLKFFREKLSQMSMHDKSHVFHLWDDLILLHSDILFGLKLPKSDDIGKVFLRQIPRITHLYGRYVVLMMYVNIKSLSR